MTASENAAGVIEDPGEMQRGLKNRHLQLIAIGGAIGTGLFLGSGKLISVSGPAIIFVYMVIGFFVFFIMRALGELLLSNLHYKTFGDIAKDMLARGPASSSPGTTGSRGSSPAWPISSPSRRTSSGSTRTSRTGCLRSSPPRASSF